MENNCIDSTVKIYTGVQLIEANVMKNAILGEDTLINKSIIGEKCRIQRRNVIYNSTIDKCSYTGYNTIIKYSKIGKYCSISWNVSIGGPNHDYKKLSTHPFFEYRNWGYLGDSAVDKQYDLFSSVGNDVWIGAGAHILSGVKVADGAVIAAGAVVTKDVEPYQICGGIPAKKLDKDFLMR